jgi:hypothetical protein
VLLPFAISVMDSIFGRRLFSLRRLSSVVVVMLVVCLYARTLVSPLGLEFDDFVRWWRITIYAIVLAFALSLNRMLAQAIARRCGNGFSLNLSMALTTVAVTYLMLTLTRPITIFLLTIANAILPYAVIAKGLPVYKYEIGVGFGLSNPVFLRVILNFSGHPLLRFEGGDVFMLLNPRTVLEDFQTIWAPGTGQLVMFSEEAIVGEQTSFIPSAIRVLTSLYFIFGLLLRPLKLFISKVWLRLLESDKPIFTMLFAGAGALAKGVQALLGWH